VYLVSMSPNCVHQSDHPILNSRYLVYEAQQAYFYGLPKNLALASVTSTPADIMGLGHRIGFVKAGKSVVTISKGVIAGGHGMVNLKVHSIKSLKTYKHCQH
jgi:hypothetical protein